MPENLGKLYLMGNDILKDKEEAVKWLHSGMVISMLSFLDHIDEFKEPSVIYSHKVIASHEPYYRRYCTARIPPNQRADRKFAEDMAKLVAQGHKKDDQRTVMHYYTD